MTTTQRRSHVTRTVGHPSFRVSFSVGTGVDVTQKYKVDFSTQLS